MAQIKRYIVANQLRAEASQHIQYYRKGALKKSGVVCRSGSIPMAHPSPRFR